MTPRNDEEANFRKSWFNSIASTEAGLAATIGFIYTSAGQR